MLRRSMFAGAAGLFVYAPANAQSADAVTLDPVIVTGTRASVASFNVPMSVDSISADQISNGQLGVNASEALSRVPGLVIQNRQNYAQDLQISSRGFGARSAFGVRGIKLIADGIPASTPDGQGQAASFNLDVADRFEVLRGPMATVYGSNAGGVIQMFTRDGQGKPRVTAEVLGGSYGTRKYRLGTEGEVNGVGFVVDASRFDTDGYRDHSAARRDQTFAKITTAPDDDSTLSIVYNGLRQKNTQDPLGVTWQSWRDNPKAVADVAETFNTRKSINNQQAGINYERRLGTASLQANVYAGQRDVRQYLAIPVAVQQRSSTHAGGVVDFSRSFYGGGVRLLQPVLAAPGDLELIVGLDADRSRDDRRGYENFVGDTLGVRGRERRNEIDTATSVDPYVQANWALGDWTLQAGLRYNTVKIDVDDRYLANGDDSGSDRYSRATPALGVMYAINPDLHVYGSAGTGFETPTQGELAYSAQGAGFNTGLRPSRSEQIEAGIKARPWSDTRVNLAVYQVRTKDEIVINGNTGGRATYQNAARTLRRGVELGIESELTRTLTANVAVSHLRAVYDSSVADGTSNISRGNRLPGVPATTLYGELAYTPFNWLSTAVEGMYRSKVQVEDSNDARAAPGYAVVNLRARFTQDYGPWKLQQLVRLENVFDKKYIGSVIVGDVNVRYYEPAPGRGWYAGMSAQYTF
ncbi:MAG: TonB-dependent receptor [Burkholderiaceae bacterium]